MIPYAIRYTKEAVQAIYKVPSGKAFEVTLAIKALAQDPIPFQSFAIDIPNMRVVKVAEYFVTYKIVKDGHYITIVTIEKDTKEG